MYFSIYRRKFQIDKNGHLQLTNKKRQFMQCWSQFPPISTERTIVDVIIYVAYIFEDKTNTI